tara:strand:+ start:432 stop:860 length:429 start_codon:yes stop_codon:yes gene_type:complete
MYCPICGFQCPTAEEQARHEKNHTEDERNEFLREQERRRVEMENKAINSGQRPGILKFSKAQGYSKVYATHWGLIPTDSDLRIDLFNESVTHPSNSPPLPEVTEHIIEAQIITPFRSAKLLSLQLGQMIDQFEKQHGEIKLN